MKAKPIEKKKELFRLENPEEAKRFVFKEKRGIRFCEVVKAVKGEIIIHPTDEGGATIKCRVFPIFAHVAKAITLQCKCEADFERDFERAAEKTAAKMEEIASQKRKYR